MNFTSKNLLFSLFLTSVVISPQAVFAQEMSPTPTPTSVSISDSQITSVDQNQTQNNNQNQNNNQSQNNNNNQSTNVASAGGSSGATSTITYTVPTKETVVTQAAAPQVITQAQTPVKELPKTGLPLAAWGLASLLPAGFGISKFRKTNNPTDSPNSLWIKKQFRK